MLLVANLLHTSLTRVFQYQMWLCLLHLPCNLHLTGLMLLLGVSKYLLVSWVVVAAWLVPYKLVGEESNQVRARFRAILRA